MWFKNLCLYRLQEPFALSAEALEEALSQHSFHPCGRMDISSQGWISPLGRDGQVLVYAAGGCLMLCLQEESKLLPAGVIRDVLNERVSEIEEREQRKLRKREKDNLRDEVFHDLLPRAFSRSKTTFGYIDTQEGWLVIDSASWKQAEGFTEILREAIGSLPIAPPDTHDAPPAVMTRWLANNDLPADVELGEEAVFEDPQTEGCEIRCKRQDLQAEEIMGHLKSGKRIRRLAVTWHERMSCVLDADTSVKRLKFLDVVQEQSGDRNPESAEERFDSDFTIMSLELKRFIPRLMELYGGEDAARPAPEPRASETA
jgi:recombination associated protein RdgC